MSALFVAELRRIAARRAVRFSMVIVAVAIVAGGAIAFVRTSSMSDATVQQRIRQAGVQREAQISSIKSCVAGHGVKDGQDTPPGVARICVPKHLASAHDPRFHHSQLAGILRGSGGILAILGLALGATLLGAEFASRGMTTLLTFESRRLRVFAAKVVTGMVVMAGLAFLALVALALAVLPALLLHGAPAAGEPGLATITGIIGRGTALVALLTGIGMAIATLGRTTAAALGAAFAYLVVLENILGSFLAAWRPWLLLGNVIVFVSGQNGGGDVSGRSVLGAGIFLTLVTGGLLAIAATSFRQRDIA